jgi:protein ImuA
MQRAALVLPALFSAVATTTEARVRADVWRAGGWAKGINGVEGAADDGEALTQSTGFAALDAELPGGGWPRAGLVEMLLVNEAEQDCFGHGELRLLAPAWGQAAMARQVWVAPPAWPYGPALAGLGWELSQLVVVAAGDDGPLAASTGPSFDKALLSNVEGLRTIGNTSSGRAGRDRAALQDQAWAAEQALRSRACSLVLWWCGAATAPTVLRRLHLAALDHGCPLFVLRPNAARQQSSPAPLRLCVQAVRGGVAVEVFKRRGPPMAAPRVLHWEGRNPPTSTSEKQDAVVRPAFAAAAA